MSLKCTIYGDISLSHYNHIHCTFLYLPGKLSKPVTTAVMSYQPSRSFRNRMKNSFEKLSLGRLDDLSEEKRSIITQFSSPDLVHIFIESFHTESRYE